MPQPYIDISIPLSEGTLPFPGDPKPKLRFASEGDWTVGLFEGVLHAGTHVDAPWHCMRAGKRLHELDLSAFLGPCYVADLREVERSVSASDLERLAIPESVQRLLIRTRNSGREYWRDAWDDNAVGIGVDAAEWCVLRGLRLIGIDYLSVEPAGESAVHRKLLENQVAILEGLHLGRVSAGEYQLIAAPVKLIGTDAAWCRALLREQA